MGIDYGFYTFITSCVILLVQVHLVNKTSMWPSIASELVTGAVCNEKPTHVAYSAPNGNRVKNVVERNGMLVYEDGDIPHPSYVYVAKLDEEQPVLDIMVELAKLRIAANTQKEVLVAANRMPPETAVSRMIADRTRAYMREDEMAGKPVEPSQPIPRPIVGSLAELPGYLSTKYVNSIGVVLGVGPGAFVLSLLQGWVSTAGLYLVDPYIHIFRGYDDPANVDDRTHQLIFENLRNQIARVVPQNKFAFIRDFSFEFAKTFEKSGQQNQLAFVWVDANHAYSAVKKDLTDWWALLRPGGMIAGSAYSGETRQAVDEFSATKTSNLVVFEKKFWLMIKS